MKKGYQISGKISQKLQPLAADIASVSPKAAAAISGINVVTHLGVDDAKSALTNVGKSMGEAYLSGDSINPRDAAGRQWSIIQEKQRNRDVNSGRTREESISRAKSYIKTRINAIAGKMSPDYQRDASTKETEMTVGQHKRRDGVPSHEREGVGNPISQGTGIYGNSYYGVGNPISQGTGIYGKAYYGVGNPISQGTGIYGKAYYGVGNPISQGTGIYGGSYN